MNPLAQPFDMKRVSHVLESAGQDDLHTAHPAQVDHSRNCTADIKSVETDYETISDVEIEPKSLKTLAEATETPSLCEWEMVELFDTQAKKPTQPPTETNKDKIIEGLKDEKERVITMLPWYINRSIEARKAHEAKEEKLENELASVKTKFEHLEAYLASEF